MAYPLVAPSGDSYYLTIRQADAVRPDMVAFRTWILEEARLAETSLLPAP